MENNAPITQAQEVTPAWVRSQMEARGIQVKTLASDTGVSQSNISSWIHGRRNMSKPVKAMFMYYFQAYKLEHLLANHAPLIS